MVLSAIVRYEVMGDMLRARSFRGDTQLLWRLDDSKTENLAISSILIQRESGAI